MNNWVILWELNKEKLFPRGKLALRSKIEKKWGKMHLIWGAKTPIFKSLLLLIFFPVPQMTKYPRCALRSAPPNETTLSEQGDAALGTGVCCRTQQPGPFGSSWAQIGRFSLDTWCPTAQEPAQPWCHTVPPSRARVPGLSSGHSSPLWEKSPSAQCVPKRTLLTLLLWFFVSFLSTENVPLAAGQWCSSRCAVSWPYFSFRGRMGIFQILVSFILPPAFLPFLFLSHSDSKMPFSFYFFLLLNVSLPACSRRFSAACSSAPGGVLLPLTFLLGSLYIIFNSCRITENFYQTQYKIYFKSLLIYWYLDPCNQKALLRI